MHLVALTHVDNRQQTVVLWQDVANHSMRRQVALLRRQLASMRRPLARLRWQLASMPRLFALVAREVWRQRFVVVWAEGYDFYSSRRRRRLVRASSSDD